LNAHENISSVCPSKTYKQSHVSADQILAVLSAPAVIILVPWGLNETLEISPSWPVSIPIQTPVCTL